MSTRAGPRLATAAGGIVRVYRGGRLEAAFTGYEGDIEAVGVDGDDVYAVTAAPVVIAIDAIGATGAPARRRTFRGAARPITDVRFDRGRGQILATSLDQFLYVWDAATGALARKLEGAGPLFAVRTSPDGSLMVGIGGISPVVWDRATGARLGQLEGHTDVVLGGEFVDHRIFVAFSVNRSALVWDAVAARPLMKLQDVEWMVFSDDRRSVALVGATGVRLWSPRAPEPDLAALPVPPAER
jgi:WD40 repeat protein